MKKFFSLFAAALMVLSASATPVKMAKADKASALKQVTRLVEHKAAVKHAPAAAQDVNFTISITDITSDGCQITITPSDLNALYYYSVCKKSLYDGVVAGQYAAQGIATLADLNNYFVDNNMYGVDAETYLSYFGYEGVTDDDWSESLDADTEFAVIVSAVNADWECVEPSVAATFKTSAKEPVVVTDTVNVHFEPYYNEEGKGGWTDYVAEDGWWQYQGQTADESLYVSLSPVETDKVAGTYTIEDMDQDYTMIVDMEEEQVYGFESITIVVEVKNHIITIRATGVCENGIYYIMTFDPIAESAVENVEAVVKAVKTVKNGQLVIIKNGVEYNALGATL